MPPGRDGGTAYLPTSRTPQDGESRGLHRRRLAGVLRHGGSVYTVLEVLLDAMTDCSGSAHMSFLGEFFGEIFEVAASAHTTKEWTAPGRTLWPMGLPYPDVGDPADPGPLSRRRHQRWHTARGPFAALSTV